MKQKERYRLMIFVVAMAALYFLENTRIYIWNKLAAPKVFECYDPDRITFEYIENFANISTNLIRYTHAKRICSYTEWSRSHQTGENLPFKSLRRLEYSIY